MRESFHKKLFFSYHHIHLLKKEKTQEFHFILRSLECWKAFLMICPLHNGKTWRPNGTGMKWTRTDGSSLWINQLLLNSFSTTSLLLKFPQRYVKTLLMWCRFFKRIDIASSCSLNLGKFSKNGVLQYNWNDVFLFQSLWDFVKDCKETFNTKIIFVLANIYLNICQPMVNFQVVHPVRWIYKEPIWIFHQHVYWV